MEPGVGLSSAAPLACSQRRSARTHPGRADVHHHLLKGGRLLGLALGVERYLLAELPGIGSPGPGARGRGSRTGTAAACSRRRHYSLHGAAATEDDVTQWNDSPETSTPRGGVTLSLRPGHKTHCFSV